MSDMNTVSLLDQMKAMTGKAQGPGVEFSTDQTQFGDVFQKAMGDVNSLQLNADNLRQRFELGDANVSIGEVMVAAQKSSLSLEATMRIRNKFVQAYQDIMNMPI